MTRFVSNPKTDRAAVRVGVVQGASSYSDQWRRQQEFPEKDLLREASRLIGHPNGNLLEGVVQPGQNVVVKPNWVLDRHPHGYDNFAVITHSAVLRAVVDLAFEAMRGEGTITIADAPQWNCNFENLLSITQVEQISEYYHSVHDFPISILDLRLLTNTSEGFVFDENRVALPGDPRGYAVADLGSESAFVGMPNADRIYGADYDRTETRKHHQSGTHQYLVSKTILDADTVIHVPKLKVHKRVGVTLNAKGMVGINGDKNWIAHYRIGPPSAGGDEYPDELSAASRTRMRVTRLAIDHLLAPESRWREAAFRGLQHTYRRLKPILGPLRYPDDDEGMPEGGNWHGNDTAWRMTADLARVVLFADTEGRVRQTQQRRFVSVVDGIVAGEHEGPLAASPKPCGVLVAGSSLLGVDLVCTRLMGFDWRKVRSLEWLACESRHDMGVSDPDEIDVRSNVGAWLSLMQDPTASDLAFAPHAQWVGHVELDRPSDAEAA